jgi:hypothetical protein
MNLLKRIRDRVGDREDILENNDPRHAESLDLKPHAAAGRTRTEKNRRKRERKKRS